MSETTKRTAARAESHIPTMISMAPAPCRMIRVEVYANVDAESREVFSVSWARVIGVLCVVETEYVKTYDGNYPKTGATHEDMIELGWRANHPPNWFPVVWPVVADGNGNDEYPIRVCHERNAIDNALYQAVVPCDWPPEQDQENAVRIGMELVKRKGERGNWVDVPQGFDSEETS
jgi:hypothetical protein